jgi:hypothetical protein
MTDGYTVVTGAVRKEATKWDGFATAVEPVHTAVHNASLDLSAFFVGEPGTTLLPQLNAVVHSNTYKGYVTYMENLLAGAKAEFPQIADALIEIATAYEQAEKVFELTNLEEIWEE